MAGAACSGVIPDPPLFPRYRSPPFKDSVPIGGPRLPFLLLSLLQPFFSGRRLRHFTPVLQAYQAFFPQGIFSPLGGCDHVSPSWFRRLTLFLRIPVIFFRNYGSLLFFFFFPPFSFQPEERQALSYFRSPLVSSSLDLPPNSLFLCALP